MTQEKDHWLPKLDGFHLVIRQDQACPVCGVPLFKAPDHLYCKECEQAYDLPIDQQLKRLNAPMLPGLESAP